SLIPCSCAASLAGLPTGKMPAGESPIGNLPIGKEDGGTAAGPGRAGKSADPERALSKNLSIPVMELTISSMLPSWPGSLLCLDGRFRWSNSSVDAGFGLRIKHLHHLLPESRVILQGLGLLILSAVYQESPALGDRLIHRLVGPDRREDRNTVA